MASKKVPSLKIYPTKDQLKSTKIIREYGVKDLEKYKEKIKKNIKVFEEAIEKEKTELKRANAMISSLKADIKEIESFEGTGIIRGSTPKRS